MFKSVSFSGYAAASQNDLLAASGLASAKAVSAADLQAAAQKLSDSGLFSRVTYRFDGQQLTFQLTPMDGLVPALFDNFPWMDVKQIDSQLRAKLPLYKGRVGVGSGLEQQVSEALTSFAAEQSIKASVVVVPFTNLKTGKTTADRFHVASPAVVISQLTFEGASPDQEKLLEPIANAAVGQDYSLSTSTQQLSTAIENVYRKEGFLDISVGKISAEQPTIAPDKISVPMKALVNEGGQYRLGKMTLAGSVLMTPEDFAKKALLKPGDVANQELLRKSLLSISGPYRLNGYLRAKITSAPNADSATHIVDYAINVEPGEQFHLGKIELGNLSDAQRAKFLSVWKMQAGDAYDESYTAQFLRKNAPALHELDGVSASYKQYEHEDTHVVDLVVTFQKGGSLN